MVRWKKEIVFLAKFFAIYFALQILIHLLPLLALETWIAGFECSIFGFGCNGNTVQTASGNFVITPDCTGLVSASVLAAIIFSLRKPGLRMKILMLAAGAIALLVLNLARVAVVLWVAVQFGAGAGELAHAVSWYSTAALILIVWFYATKKIAGIKSFEELL